MTSIFCNVVYFVIACSKYDIQLNEEYNNCPKYMPTGDKKQIGNTSIGLQLVNKFTTCLCELLTAFITVFIIIIWIRVWRFGVSHTGTVLSDFFAFFGRLLLFVLHSTVFSV